jgi:hypothetical protein
MGKNKENDGFQQGAQEHAASGQGERTRTRQAEIANTPDPLEGRTGPQHDPEKIRRHDTTGRDRLFEDREQHDEAEKNSEKTRLSRDLDRHGHLPNDELSERDRASSSKRKN